MTLPSLLARLWQALLALFARPKALPPPPVEASPPEATPVPVLLPPVAEPPAPRPSAPKGDVWPVVRERFRAFSAGKEGVAAVMYSDKDGAVTTGIGNLLPSPDEAAKLPWRRPDGSRATRSEIEAEWHWLKGNAEAANLSVAYTLKNPKHLHLADEDVTALYWSRFNLNVTELCKRFPAMPSWPAAGQMGVMSLAWACGTAFHYPKLDAAVRRRDFVTAAEECTIQGNPPRSKAQKALFEEAARVEAEGSDPSALAYRVA